MSIRVRFATADDAVSIHRCITALASYEREPDAVEVTPTELARQLGESPPPFECLLAELDGDPVGLALFFHNYSTWRGRSGIYLEDLWVDDAARGRGVGRALMVRLAELAAARGCARLELAVLDWNQLAISFYRDLGARSQDGWTLFRLDGDALDSLRSSQE